MRKNFRGKDNIASMSTNIKKFNIAVIPGDGIGKEVTPQAQAVLEKATEGIAEFSYTDFDLGAERYLRDGQILPENELEEIKKHDAVLLGAVGDPRVKAGVLERGLLLKLRFELDLYVNAKQISQTLSDSEDNKNVNVLLKSNATHEGYSETDY